MRYRPQLATPLVLTVLATLGAVGAMSADGRVSSRGGYAALQPGTLVTLPFVGRLSWRCEAGRRSAAFSAARPTATQMATLTGDGHLLARVTLGLRTRSLAAPLGSWRVLVFHVTKAGEPASVGTTLTVRFRVLGPPTSECFVPRFSVAERTRSHSVGA
jgi:hypothetical protein